ncbi:MAG: PEP-CTERM sorting domain-containing protein [Acetobacteraceae bacterium]
MKIISAAVAGVLASAGLAGTARAVPITYTVSANEFVFLGFSASIRPVPVSITGAGDTADAVTLAPGVLGIPLTSASFTTTIGGGTILTPLDFVVEQTTQTGGFFTSGLASVLAESAAFFATYDGITSAGPIAGLPAGATNITVSVVTGSPLETTLTFGNGGNSYSFTAATPSVVPEPMTLALLGAGLIGLAATRRRGTPTA